MEMGPGWSTHMSVYSSHPARTTSVVVHIAPFLLTSWKGIGETR